MWSALEKIGLVAAVALAVSSLGDRPATWPIGSADPLQLSDAAACVDLPSPAPSAFEQPVFRGTLTSNQSSEAPIDRATSRAPAGPRGFESWSETRRAAFQRLVQVADREPVGAMEIPSLDLLVPIYEGGDDVALTLGAGRIEATDTLDGQSNSALAGHRDGYFRALREVEIGEQVLVRTDTLERTYSVTGARVVPAEAVWVLDPTDSPALTLVTEHPFYSAGPAPNRFVVRADLVHEQRHRRDTGHRVRI